MILLCDLNIMCSPQCIIHLPFVDNEVILYDIYYISTNLSYNCNNDEVILKY